MLINMEKNVQLKYRLYRRRNGVFYWRENESSKQGTLRTSDRREAERLLNAMNESHREPTLNLNLARDRRIIAPVSTSLRHCLVETKIARMCP
jgi:hypothetical protein